MKSVRVKKMKFQKALRNSNTTRPSVSLISYIRVRKDRIQIDTYDIEAGQISYVVPAKAKSEFEFAVELDKLLEVLKSIETSRASVVLNLNSDNLEIVYKRKKIDTIPIVKDYKPTQIKEMPKNIIATISEKLFKEAVMKTSYLLPDADDIYKYAKTKRLCFTFLPDRVEIAGTDGHKLSVYTIHTNTPLKRKEYTIFVSSARKLETLLNKYNRKLSIDIAVEDNYIFFKSSNWLYYTEVVEGYLDYKPIMNLDFSLEVILPVNKLKVFLKSLMRVRETKEAPVYMEILDDKMRVYSKFNNSECMIDLKYSNIDKPFTIALSKKFLHDVMKQIDEDNIIMRFIDKNLPVSIQPENNKDYTTIIAPMYC